MSAKPPLEVVPLGPLPIPHQDEQGEHEFLGCLFHSVALNLPRIDQFATTLGLELIYDHRGQSFLRGIQMVVEANIYAPTGDRDADIDRLFAMVLKAIAAREAVHPLNAEWWLAVSDAYPTGSVAMCKLLLADL